jgi:geranylgeranyl diphosphate synthase type II
MEAMGYSLFAGGKRVRPVLLLATYDIFPANGLDPLPAACAVEFIHTYSLIHDDLPAMDNDDFRRGKPTNHKKFGEALAILAGDGLLTEAFGIVARSYGPQADSATVELVAEIAGAAGAAGMVGGQVIDTLEVGTRHGKTDLEQLHRMKTGALLSAAVRCGAILGHASDTELAALNGYAQRIGLAFQVADDVLDVVGTREELGKSIGKDEAQRKTTFVTLLGVEASRGFAHRLADEAQAELEIFGTGADALRAMARFIVTRTS